MGQQINRSLRLIGRIAASLDSSTGSNGEIFYDTTNSTLRIYNGSTRAGTILANRAWVSNQLTNNIEYGNLLNKPVLPTFAEVASTGSYNDLSNRPVLFSGSYNDLTDRPPATPTATTGTLGLVRPDGVTITIVDGVISSTGGGGGGTVDLTGYATETFVASAVSAVTKTSLGLGNVTNESKATMFTSPAFTGTVALPAGTTIGGSTVAQTGNVTFTGSTISLSTGTTITFNRTVSFTNIGVSGTIGAGINALNDVDTVSTPPTAGQVLKYNGTQWVPGVDATSGGAGTDAATLSGQPGTYYLNADNHTNRPDLTLYATLDSPSFTGNVQGLNAAMVGLDSVTNESKATMFNSPVFTGTPTVPGYVTESALTGLAPINNPGFTGTVTGITATMVGLGNVTNESKETMFANPTFTGTVSGVSKSAVGLSNVENTAISTWPGSANITTVGTVTSAVLVNSQSGLGYVAGAGGAVNQGTNRFAAVTINRITGYIQLFNAAGVTNSWTSFTVNNSTVATGDVVVLNPATSTNTYLALVSRVVAGSVRISFISIAGTAQDQPRFNFAVIKGAQS
jgi:hypothetical protein